MLNSGALSWDVIHKAFSCIQFILLSRVWSQNIHTRGQKLKCNRMNIFIVTLSCSSISWMEKYAYNINLLCITFHQYSKGLPEYKNWVMAIFLQRFKTYILELSVVSLSATVIYFCLKQQGRFLLMTSHYKASNSCQYS